MGETYVLALEAHSPKSEAVPQIAEKDDESPENPYLKANRCLMKTENYALRFLTYFKSAINSIVPLFRRMIK